MSYQPTLEDMAYLVQQRPENFVRPEIEFRRLQDAAAMSDEHAATPVFRNQAIHETYKAYLNGSGEVLTESPIPAEPSDDESRQDPEFGAMCVECASLTPCIEKVEVICHSGENTRTLLQGENELIDTDCRIYFIADKAVSGDLSFEGFLQGNTFKDEGTVTITLADDCPHGTHSLYWTSELNGTPITSGTAIPFTVQTNPRSPLLNLPNLGDNGLAFEAATIILDIIMNRVAMVKEEAFSISYDGTRDFTFISVTVPSLKFAGKVSVLPPQIGTENIPRSEGRRLRRQLGMGNNPRQLTQEQGWQIDANMEITCGSNTKDITVGKYRSETQTYDSEASLRRQNQAQQQSSGIDRFIGALSHSAKSLAKKLSTEHDDRKLLNLYTVGPKLGLTVTTEQAEATNAPGLTWTLEAGLSIDFLFGVKVDIYQALKRMLRALPVVTPAGAAGHTLLLFLEDAERGRNLGVARYQITPFLFIDIALAAGFNASEKADQESQLMGKYDFFERKFEEGSVQGNAEIKLTAKAAGGIMGSFDSIITEERVFRYEAEISTEGGIRIKTEEGQWGYQLYHLGASLKIKSFRKLNVDIGRDQSENSGYPSSSSQAVQTAHNTEWIEDKENTNTYALAQSYTGEFIPFS